LGFGFARNSRDKLVDHTPLTTRRLDEQAQ
jgi:hypothetical protein